MSKQFFNSPKSHILLFTVLITLAHTVNPAEGLDIQQIELWEGKYWLDGVLESKPYGLWLSVNGTGITDVNMTLPDGNSIMLEEYAAPGGGWRTEIEDCNSLQELREDFPIGDYTFTFNGGADSVTLHREPNIPTGFANIIYPTNGANDVPLNLTITWQSCADYGDSIMAAVFDETACIGQFSGFININEISWTPDLLEPGHLHELEVMVFDGTASQPYQLTTEHGDSFNYYDLFENCNTILFTTVGSAAPYYRTQTIPFIAPHATIPFGPWDIDFIFIKSIDDVNCWAGEDYNGVELVAINDNINSEGLLVPTDGFDGNQGVVLAYDVADESGNGALCALSTAFDTTQGGQSGSGLPTNLSDCTLEVDIDFNVPFQPSISTLQDTLGFWLAEADGDSFETPGIFDLAKGWHTYSYDLNNLADYIESSAGGGTFGDSPVTLLALSFEDPNNEETLDKVIYFIDNFRITGETTFFEDFEDRCTSSIEGDINFDCKVNFIDLAILAGNWLECTINPPETCWQ